MGRQADATQEQLLTFRLKSATSEAFEHPAKNIEQYSSRSYWCTYSKKSSHDLTIELEYKSFVSTLTLWNKSMSEVDISIAVENNPRSFVPVKTACRLAHYRQCQVPIGYLPCQYIRFRFRNTPNTLSQLNGILVKGMPCHRVQSSVESSFYKVLGTNTENLLYGESLHDSLPQTSRSRAWLAHHKRREEESIARLERSLEHIAPPLPVMKKPSNSWS